MPLVDDRGRLLGKINLIDAGVAIFGLLLIPLAYGAFLLFRVPVPVVTSIRPSTVQEHDLSTIAITGKDLRPFLRARIGTYEARFLVQSPSEAEIKLPDLPAGTYDLALYDEANELLVKPGALTVASPAALPTAWLKVETVGGFIGLTTETAALIGVKSRFAPRPGTGTPAPIAEIVSVKAPEPQTSRVKIGPNVFATAVLPALRVPAIVRLSCVVSKDQCAVGSTIVAPGATISLPMPAPQTTLTFAIDQVFPEGLPAAFPTVAFVRVRFVASPEILNAMKVGDMDLAGDVTNSARATLTQIGSDQQPATALTTIDGLLRRSLQVQQPALAFTGTVRVPVEYTPSGWSYKDRAVKVGSAFTFETVSGGMLGSILDVKLADQR